MATSKMLGEPEDNTTETVQAQLAAQVGGEAAISLWAYMQVCHIFLFNLLVKSY